MSQVNVWAVLVSALAAMAVGSIWYGPLFGKLFRHEMGMDAWSAERQAREKKRMGFAFFLQFVASLVMFFSLASFYYGLGYLGVRNALMVSGMVWLGFIVPVKVGDAVWGGNWKLFWLAIGNFLVTLLVVGVIIGAWK